MYFVLGRIIKEASVHKIATIRDGIFPVIRNTMAPKFAQPIHPAIKINIEDWNLFNFSIVLSSELIFFRIFFEMKIQMGSIITTSPTMTRNRSSVKSEFKGSVIITSEVEIRNNGIRSTTEKIIRILVMMVLGFNCAIFFS